MSIPLTVQMRWVWQNATVDYAVNVLHFANPLGTTVNDALAQTIDNEVKTALTASGLLAFMPIAVQLDRVGLRNLDIDDQPLIENPGPGVLGTSALDLLPLNVSGCVTLRTAKAGRRFRGRVYIPGFAENANTTTGTIGATVSTDMTEFIEGVRDRLQLAGFVLGVVSQRAIDDPGPPPTFFPPVFLLYVPASFIMC